MLRISWIFGAVLAATLSTNLRCAEGALFFLETPEDAKSTSGEPVGAEAWVTTGANTVTIQITNTEINIKDISQVLTGLTLSLSGGASHGSIVDSKGNVVFVDSQGNYSLAPGDPIRIDGNVTIGNQFYSGWTMSSLDLSVFNQTPNFGVLDDTQPNYGTNGSIAGNTPHNPFTRGTDSFTLSILGVTDGTLVTGGSFQFGTNQNGGIVTLVEDDVKPVPEPTSLACWSLLGLIGFGYRRWGPKTCDSARY